MSAYNELKAFLASSTAITAQSYAFFDFVIEKTTLPQYREILKIADTVDVLHYLACAYGCYVLAHNHGRQGLILNPEKIFSTDQEKRAFIELFINYARDELTQVQVQNTIRETHNM